MSNFNKLFSFSNHFYMLSSFSSRKDFLRSLAISLEDSVKDAEFDDALEQLLLAVSSWKDRYGQKMEQFAGLKGLPKSKVGPVQTLNSVRSFDINTLPTIKAALAALAETASLNGVSDDGKTAWINISKLTMPLSAMCDKQMTFLKEWEKENPTPQEQPPTNMTMPEVTIKSAPQMGSVKDRAQNLATQLINIKRKLFPEGDKPVPMEAERRGLLNKAEGLVKQMAGILKSTYKGPLNDAARKIVSETLNAFYIDLTYDDLQMVPSLENGRLVGQQA